MAQGVGDAESHATLPASLHRRNVSDCSQMIVVKAVPQAKQETGDDGGNQFGIHTFSEFVC
jgi:hypothetical protein